VFLDQIELHVDSDLDGMPDAWEQKIKKGCHPVQKMMFRKQGMASRKLQDLT